MVPLFGNSKELAAFTHAQFGGSEEPLLRKNESNTPGKACCVQGGHSKCAVAG